MSALTAVIAEDEPVLRAELREMLASACSAVAGPASGSRPSGESAPLLARKASM